MLDFTRDIHLGFHALRRAMPPGAHCQHDQRSEKRDARGGS